MSNKRNRITIDLKPNQLMVLTELKDALNTNYSLLIRAIIQNFLYVNEETLERITLSKKGELENAKNKSTTEEEEEY